MSLCQMMKPEQVKEETWWTLGEVLYYCFGTDGWKYGLPYITGEGGFDSWWGEADSLKQNYLVDTDENDFDTAEIILPIIFNRFYHHYCCSQEEEPDDLVDGIIDSYREKPYFKFLVDMGNVFNFTKQKYSTLLNLYASEKENLLNKVQTLASGTTRYNDTPQDTGDFSDDSHTTNISQTTGESSTDVKPLIERLADINRLYQQVLLDWTNEFERLFIEEGNIE